MKKIFLVLGATLILAACNTTNNISSYNRTSEVASSVSSAELRNAILEAGKERGWTVKAINNNTIQGTISAKGGISATTNVTYGSGQYQFKLVNSTGLGQNENSIHRRYNNWINYWDIGIQNRINK